MVKQLCEKFETARSTYDLNFFNDKTGRPVEFDKNFARPLVFVGSFTTPKKHFIPLPKKEFT